MSFAHAQTPYLVKDINITLSSELESSSPSDFVAYRDRIFFVATTASFGTELWSTDGTAQGTSMVLDIVPGTASASPSGLIVVNGVFLFYARDENHGFELWTSDGTAAGTHLLADVNPGPNSAAITTFVVRNDRMLFTADDGTNGRELWITDGTAAGTRMVKDITPGTASSSFSALRVMGNAVYFLAAGGLWKTDGTEAGTVKLTSVTGRYLLVAGSKLFFEGHTAATGWELWVSDGTESGTHIVTETFPGTRSGLDTQYSSSLSTVAIGNRVVFVATDETHGRELWISDGTAAGTRIIRDLEPGVVGAWDRMPVVFAAVGERAFFQSSDQQHGTELWSTDGTESGTGLFADIYPGITSSSPYAFTNAPGRLYFAVQNSDNGAIRVWMTDGTPGGTRAVGGVENVGLDSSARLSPVGGRLYFGGHSELAGIEPWVTDGTAAGSRMIANIAVDGAPSSSPYLLTAARDLLFFTATIGISPSSPKIPATALWRTDGTEEGTFTLLDDGDRVESLKAAGPFAFSSIRPSVIPRR